VSAEFRVPCSEFYVFLKEELKGVVEEGSFGGHFGGTEEVEICFCCGGPFFFGRGKGEVEVGEVECGGDVEEHLKLDACEEGHEIGSRDQI
jgi:hypothetical protein